MHIETVKTAYRRYAGFYDALFGPVLQPGRRAVLAEYTVDRMARNTMEVYRQVLV